MFHALVDKDSAARSATLQTLARKFINNKYLAAAFVCLHGVFYPRFPSIRTLKDDELGKMLSLFAQYVHRLHDLAFEAAPCETFVVAGGVVAAEVGKVSTLFSTPTGGVPRGIPRVE